MPIAEFSNWLRRVIWGRILRGCHHQTRLWNSVDTKWLWRILQSSCLFSVFPNINGEHESTLATSKKYSWCIPVQKEIKPIIWGAAITPEPWNRQQCWFIFEDPNVRVARASRQKNMAIRMSITHGLVIGVVFLFQLNEAASDRYYKNKSDRNIRSQTILEIATSDNWRFALWYDSAFVIFYLNRMAWLHQIRAGIAMAHQQTSALDLYYTSSQFLIFRTCHAICFFIGNNKTLLWKILPQLFTHISRITYAHQ